MSQIVYNDDTVAIFSDIMPLIKQIYLHYFIEDKNAEKGVKKYSIT